MKLARGAGLSTDNLAGVPTYEAILSYAKSQLTQAAFVTLDEQASDCVYVSAQDGECQQDYWVRYGGFFYRSMTAATVSKIVSVSSSSVSMSTRSSTSSTRRSPGSMPRGRSFRSGRSGGQGAG